MSDDSAIEKFERRCPRLGSPISFQYCLISGEDDGICWKVLDCWWEIFNVEAYLKQHMPKAEFAQLMARAEQPKNKISSIIEMIEKAKNREKAED